MTNRNTVRKLATDLRELNPEYRIVPIGDIISIDQEDLLDLKWPDGWSFNGYDQAFIPGTDEEVFILGGFTAHE